ncbi:MAG: VWA domain-containing protein [Deltaproteobacteria bacterium]|nr:VWA domain-containing protein [Deltaproteobacteria bacterium]
MPRPPLALFALIALASPAAHADELRTAREQPLAEVAHTVEIRIADGVATYQVRRRFANRGKVAVEAGLAIDLPSGAAATGLRIRARDRWYDGELVERRELTGLGAHAPKAPALLQWLRADKLYLQVFPVLPGQVSTVEYTLTVPTRYAAGRYWVSYPRIDPGEARRLAVPTVTVVPAWGDAATEILVDGRRVAPGTPVVLTPPVREPWRDAIPDAPESERDAGMAPIAVAAPSFERWQARLGRAVASPANAFARLEVDVAPRLSRLPVKPHVVFVVDASYSGGEQLVAAQLATLRAYLAHVPDAQVEIVAYRRRAARVFDTFVPAADVDRRLRDARYASAFVLGNGSALDEGTRLAAAALAGRTGDKRIVVFTDELVRRALDPAAAAATLAALAPETIVHVVAPQVDRRDRIALERDDARPLAPLATRHHGIMATLGGFPLQRERDEDLPPAVLELVRPTRIERAAVTGGFALPSPTLREGDGVRLFAARTAKEAPARVALTGVLWSDPIRHDVEVTAGFSRATAAFVFGLDEHHRLSRDEMMTVALAGRAVSPVTSYVASEPGTRPSTIGLGRAGAARRGAGAGFDDATCYCGTLHEHEHEHDLGRLVDTSACVAAHRPPAGWAAILVVETTKDEVVDVTAPAQSTPFQACLVEAVWATRLDAAFTRDHDSFTVVLGAR